MAVKRHANEETSARNGGGNLVPSFAVASERRCCLWMKNG